ncbi:MAG: ester cyclase [Chloroflexi bacterium]|nr:ester cyclase [Chloroflexota bacterium]
MATHELDTLYCRFIDHVVNRRRLDHLDQFLAANVVEHAYDITVGIEAAHRTLARWLAAFPDLHLVIEDLVVDGDRLMARLTASGTHPRRLAGLEPTAARVSVPVFEAWSVPGERCVERWLQVDGCALRHQLRLGADPRATTSLAWRPEVARRASALCRHLGSLENLSPTCSAPRSGRSCVKTPAGGRN